MPNGPSKDPQTFGVYGLGFRVLRLQGSLGFGVWGLIRVVSWALNWVPYLL